MYETNQIVIKTVSNGFIIVLPYKEEKESFMDVIETRKARVTKKPYKQPVLATLQDIVNKNVFTFKTFPEVLEFLKQQFT